MQFKTILAAAALNMSIFSVSHAFDTVQAPVVTVEYSDLDLSRPQGEAVLYQRIVQAARRVCQSTDPTSAENAAFRLQFAQLHDVCLRNAVAGAVADMHRPLFSDYAAMRLRQAPASGIVMASK